MSALLSPHVTLAVAVRVLRQVRRDHRTLAMLVVLPSGVLTLLWWMFREVPTVAGSPFDRLGPPLLAIIPFIVMFLVTSVTTLRERTSGTLERLLSMPVGKLDLLLGYALAFGLLALVQSTLAVAVCVGLLGLSVQGPVGVLVAVAVADAVLGTALGLLVSAFAATEFQAVQFMPLVVVPQILLCGLFVPTDQMPSALGAVASLLPLTYAVEAMQAVAGVGEGASSWDAVAGDVASDLLVVLALALVALGLGAATLRRRTA